jgi:predicted alpha/beta superfamily hydrolase
MNKKSYLNIKEIFETYQKNNNTIYLRDGQIVISIREVAAGSVLKFDYYSDINGKIYYKIIIYPEFINYYTFWDEEMSSGKEIMIDRAKEFHPDFFEWMLWNLP